MEQSILEDETIQKSIYNADKIERSSLENSFTLYCKCTEICRILDGQMLKLFKKWPMLFLGLQYGWLNNFYSIHMATVISIVSWHGLRISTHIRRNQPKSS